MKIIHNLFLSFSLSLSLSHTHTQGKKNKNMIFSVLSNSLAGTVYGSVDNPKLTYTGDVKLWAGSNTISCLSISVGLPVSGCFYQ
jgi:hypothetical protein